MRARAPRSPKRLRGLFVTGTGTEIGKTVVASAIAAALGARGERVAVFKPVVTGLAETDGALPDHELLRRSARSPQSEAQVAPYRFELPVSPHLAAELAHTRVEPRLLVEQARLTAEAADVLVVEGVGGLLVPLTRTYLVRDFAIDLDLPLVIAARPGLGTINHSLLTIEAARSVGLEVAAVVFTPWPDEPSELEISNRMTVAASGRVTVYGLPHVDTRDAVEPLEHLPVEAWIGAVEATRGEALAL